MASDPAAAGRLGLFLALVAATGLSQFHRASTGAIGPEIAADLGLGPQGLAAVNAAFFAALGLAQIPVGLASDRWGPRLVVAVLTVLAVAGALLHTVADSALLLAAARGLAGLGCAASFMAAVVLCGRWFAAARFTTVLSWVFALSNLGVLAAGTPLALAAAGAGWRSAFVLVAAASAVIGVGFWLAVRDEPPGRPAAARSGGGPAEALGGLWRVWRSPGLLPVFALHLFVYASLIVLIALWAGPYLADVHGLGAVERGHVLTAMAAAQVAGLLCYGPLDRLANSRKRVAVGGALLSIAVFGLLAVLPDPPLALAVALLLAACSVTAYGIVLVAHGRALFPPELVGRGVTSLNLAQVIGSATLPLLTGAVAEWASAGALPLPEAAYRLVFATIAGGLALGLCGYLFARDVPPR